MIIVKVCRKKLRHIILALQKAKINYEKQPDYLIIFVSNIEETNLPENIKDIIVLNQKGEKND